MHDTNAFSPPVLCAFSWFAGAPDWLRGAMAGRARNRCQGGRPSAMGGEPGGRRRGNATAGRLQRGSTLRWIRSEQAGLGGVVGANVSGSIRDVVGSTGLASRQRVCVSEGAAPVYRSSPIGRFRRVVRQALHSAGCLSYSGPVLMDCCWQTTFTGFLRQLLSGGFFSSLIRLQQFHSTCCFRHAASSAGARSAFLGLCVAEEAKSLADKKGEKTTGRRAMTGKFAELLLAQQTII